MNSFKKKIFIIYGPNMNIIGHKKTLLKNITLNKINNCLKKSIQAKNYDIKFLQTNEEGKAINQLQRCRNKIQGIIIFPGPWQNAGYSINDTLEILDIPYVTVSTGEKVNIICGKENVNEPDILYGCKLAVEKLFNLIISFR